MSVLSQPNSIDICMVEPSNYQVDEIQEIEREMEEAQAAFSLSPVPIHDKDEEQKAPPQRKTTPIEEPTLMPIFTPINQTSTKPSQRDTVSLITPFKSDENYKPPKPKRMGTYDQERDKQVRVI